MAYVLFELCEQIRCVLVGCVVAAAEGSESVPICDFEGPFLVGFSVDRDGGNVAVATQVLLEVGPSQVSPVMFLVKERFAVMCLATEVPILVGYCLSVSSCRKQFPVACG